MKITVKTSLENILIFRLINSKEESQSSSALGILACLCHGNYIAGKLLLSTLTTEERKELYSKNYQDARTKIFLDHLLTSLNRRHFLTQPPKYESLEQHISLLSDAFCAGTIK